ncbi:hypothetical protein [Streptomyces sp. NPDC005969]|uniref:hypothetical protein n=1 Tax=Streptomyces sp. NPDC005969 TaxID=3156722 RepID=UPI0033D94FBD
MLRPARPPSPSRLSFRLIPKDDTVSGIRTLHNAAQSAVKARTATARRPTAALDAASTEHNPDLRAAFGIGPTLRPSSW